MLLTHWPSAGSVNAGNEIVIRASSLARPSLRTLSVTVKVSPRTIDEGWPAGRLLTTGTGATGAGWTGAGPSLSSVVTLPP